MGVTVVGFRKRFGSRNIADQPLHSKNCVIKAPAGAFHDNRSVLIRCATGAARRRERPKTPQAEPNRQPVAGMGTGEKVACAKSNSAADAPAS